MKNIHINSEYKKDLTKRLNRIEGQLKGIQRMIDEEKTCVDILTQVAAIRGALNKVGGVILEMYSYDCAESITNSDDKEKAISDLTNTIQKFLNFID